MSITPISFLLVFVIFFYQEYNNSLQQAKTDAFQAQTVATLQVQAQQIQNLAYRKDSGSSRSGTRRAFVA